MARTSRLRRRSTRPAAVSRAGRYRAIRRDPAADEGSSPAATRFASPASNGGPVGFQAGASDSGQALYSWRPVRVPRCRHAARGDPRARRGHRPVSPAGGAPCFTMSDRPRAPPGPPRRSRVGQQVSCLGHDGRMRDTPCHLRSVNGRFDRRRRPAIECHLPFDTAGPRTTRDIDERQDTRTDTVAGRSAHGGCPCCVLLSLLSRSWWSPSSRAAAPPSPPPAH